MTAIKTSIREIQKWEDKRWVIYTDLLSSKLAIKNNGKNYPILYQIYDILAKLHNQGKQITLCKTLAHIEIKGNEEADRAAKKAIDMPGMTTKDYLIQITTWPSGELEAPSGKGNGKTSTSKPY